MQINRLDQPILPMQPGVRDRPFEGRPLGMNISKDPLRFRQRGFVFSSATSTEDSPGHLAACTYYV
ncbi:hypothetical protein GGS24DRAFT_466933 [Hypoxylon argillaceum]|nr:hypothetical protein GGS24DRAFT_466933 [Hypoxylon argillaceum]